MCRPQSSCTTATTERLRQETPSQGMSGHPGMSLQVQHVSMPAPRGHPVKRNVNHSPRLNTIGEEGQGSYAPGLTKYPLEIIDTQQAGWMCTDDL